MQKVMEVSHHIMGDIAEWCVVLVIFIIALWTFGRWLAGNSIDYKRWTCFFLYSFIVVVSETIFSDIVVLLFPTSVFTMFFPCLKGAIAMHMLVYSFVTYLDMQYQKKVESFKIFVTIIILYVISFLRLGLVTQLHAEWFALSLIDITENVTKTTLVASVVLNFFSRKPSDNNFDLKEQATVVEEVLLE